MIDPFLCFHLNTKFIRMPFLRHGVSKKDAGLCVQLRSQNPRTASVRPILCCWLKRLILSPLILVSNSWFCVTVDALKGAITEALQAGRVCHDQLNPQAVIFHQSASPQSGSSSFLGSSFWLAWPDRAATTASRIASS
jgi:hypothetical protein